MRTISVHGSNEVIIGVTGHRTLDDPLPLISGVDRALEAIKSSFAAECLAILSPLAEGADRIVVDRALTIVGTKLIVNLPMPIEIYQEDFHSPSSREEFLDLLQRAEEVIEMPRAAQRDDSYRNAGEYLVSHCDVLIAIWDGLPARGPGGTAEVITLARDRNMPLAWIYARPNGNEDVKTAAPGANHGEVYFERFPE
ncbi:MAG: hypothetical protein KAR65_11045 [Anaerolineales bacterium]|nr:hypothetical protein [Anaerolineales bacterium]MCK5635170.1 hypothetical protein [Anaerolineales bacterium]